MSSVWLVTSLIVYFAVLLLVATVKRRKETQQDYFLAGRTMPSWALGIAFIATWYGGNSALISVDSAYTNGMSSWWILGGPTVIAGLALVFLAPVIRRVGAASQNGIMAARYNASSANLLSVVLTIYLIVWGSSQMVAIGDFFVVFLGVPYAVAIVIATAVALLYAVLGGFRAVVLTEAVQFLLLFNGLVVTMLVAFYLSGGWENIRQTAVAERDPGYFSLFHGIGANLTYIISFGLAFTIDGAAWQRIQAARNPKGARLTALTAMGGFIPLYFFVVFAGIASIAVFDSIPERGIVSTLASGHMHPFLGTLVFVGVAAAIMSTICTTFNLSSLYMTELFVKYVRPNVSERRKVHYGMVATVVAATLGFLVAVQIQSALSLLALASEILAAGIFVPMIFGFFWRRGTAAGAIASIVIGGGFILYGFLIELGAPFPSFWEGGATRILIGMGLSLVAYVGTSLATAPDYAKSDAFIAKARGKEPAPETADVSPR